MNINKKATSIVEAMILMMILVTWVTWMYNVYMSSVKLEKANSNKIIAINIAREWIEAMKNIRDTNWIIFSSDKDNCWNSLNYNALCVWDNTDTYDITSWSYKIYKNTENRWTLLWTTLSNYSVATYRNEHRVWIDSKGFYTQTWTVNNLTPLFTREIKISYPEDTNWDTLFDSNDEKMEVRSLVQRRDSNSQAIHKVELVENLSNWLR